MAEVDLGTRVQRQKRFNGLSRNIPCVTLEERGKKESVLRVCQRQSLLLELELQA